jgi:hypothetical protein
MDTLTSCVPAIPQNFHDVRWYLARASSYDLLPLFRQHPAIPREFPLSLVTGAGFL